MGRTVGPRRVVLVVAALVGSLVAVPMPATGQTPECTIVGTEGDDVLVGASGDDVICGLGGNDTISGGSGDDIIFGGAGDDVINGGSGNDIIYGEEGADQIDGGSGNDVIEGGPGDDTLTGGSGNDDLRGGPGADSATGGSGTDICAAETTSSCETVVPDDLPPSSIELTAPLDDQVVFSVTEVVASISPSEADGTVDLLIAGELIATTQIEDGSASFQWDTTTKADGEVEIEVVARDAGGAVTSMSSAGVEVDNSLSDMERIFADFDAGLITDLGVTAQRAWAHGGRSQVEHRRALRPTSGRGPAP